MLKDKAEKLAFVIINPQVEDYHRKRLELSKLIYDSEICERFHHHSGDLNYKTDASIKLAASRALYFFESVDNFTNEQLHLLIIDMTIVQLDCKTKNCRLKLYVKE